MLHSPSSSSNTQLPYGSCGLDVLVSLSLRKNRYPIRAHDIPPLISWISEIRPFRFRYCTRSRPARTYLCALAVFAMSNADVTIEESSVNVTPESLTESVEDIKLELDRSVEQDVTNDHATENESSKKDDAVKANASVNRPPYIPPHLMGRDLSNPGQDLAGSGRRVQKPRLGVKVPYRNLTSQIVSQDEIAQEILERSLRKYSYTDVPESSDVFFAMKLTHRLANKISSPVDSFEKTDKRKENVGMTKQTDSTNQELIFASENADVPSSTSNAIKKVALPPVNNSKDADKQNENLDSKVEELYAEISSSLTEDCKTAVTLTNSSKLTGSGTVVNGTTPELDHDTLLAILEDTPELTDISSNAVPVFAPKPETTGFVQRKKRIKRMLDPDTEKELALKQLMDFEKKKNEDRLRKLTMRKDVAEGPAPQQPIVVGQQNGLETNVKVAVTAPAPVPVTPPKPKKPRATYTSLSTAPKRFPKKYHRIIKRQLRSSKLKSKATSSPEQQKKQLPEVPEVQIAIDRYIKTYAKRKYKPDEKAAEKPAEKKAKTDNVAAVAVTTTTATTTVSNENAKQPEAPKSQNENHVEEATDTPEEKEEEAVSGPKPKTSSKVMREINRLLGDEGAINMIYSIEQKRLPDSKRDTNILPSLRRKKKDLLLKTKLVKNAVLRLSMSSSQTSPGRLVRRASPEASVETAAGSKSASPLRKASIESNESNTSDHLPPKTRKVAAEASRIIRRHSSSSNYSSDEEMPPPGEKSRETVALQTSQTPAEKNNNESSIKPSQATDKEAAVQKGKSAKNRRESKEGARDSNATVEVLPNGTNYAGK